MHRNLRGRVSMAEQCSDRLREGRETQPDMPSVAVSELV
jgi:hypothetical protein